MSGDEYTSQLLDLVEPERRPDILYHYTSAAGLLGIIQTRSIWSTSIRYLNDSKEYELALELAQRILGARKSGANSEFKLGLYEVMLEGLRYVHGTEIFVSSFSEHGDQLSQWRGYCPAASGYAIGFTPESLVESTGSNQTGFLAPCVYERKKQKELVEEVVEKVIQFSHDLERRQRETRPHDWWDVDRDRVFREERDRTYREAFKIFARLLPLLGPVIKHDTFAEESEWRLVSLATAEDQLDPELRPGHSMLIPYIRHPLRLEENRLRLPEIMVGPTPHSELAAHAVEILLEKYGATASSIRKSEIPYRDW